MAEQLRRLSHGTADESGIEDEAREFATGERTGLELHSAIPEDNEDAAKKRRDEEGHEHCPPASGL